MCFSTSPPSTLIVAELGESLRQSGNGTPNLARSHVLQVFSKGEEVHDRGSLVRLADGEGPESRNRHEEVDAATTRTLCFPQTDSESSAAWTEQSSRSDALAFAFMLEAHSHQFAYVLVREGVVHYSAVASRLDQVESPQQSELVRNGGHVHPRTAERSQT